MAPFVLSELELDQIEKVWSAQAHRQSAALQLTPSRNVGAIVTGRRETPEEKWHNEVSYDFVNNQYKLTWHVNANTPPVWRGFTMHSNIPLLASSCIIFKYYVLIKSEKPEKESCYGTV